MVRAELVRKFIANAAPSIMKLPLFISTVTCLALSICMEGKAIAGTIGIGSPSSETLPAFSEDSQLLSTKAANPPPMDFLPLDLSGASNRDFEDKVAGDGKGGWSDQGPQNDMKAFEVGRRELAGILFDVIDPKTNKGHSVMTFDSPQAKTELVSATTQVDRPNGDAKFLYLLHTSCWNQQPLGTEIGMVDVKFEDGTTANRIVRNGVEIADWWNPGDQPNAKVVATIDSGSSRVGVYVSKLKLSDVSKPVKAITFTTSRRAIWIVIAGSLSSKDVDLTSSNIHFVSDKDWKATDMSDVQIKSGSALDLSSFSEPGPAGKEGFSIVNDSGKLAFDKEPTKARRLLGSTVFLLRRLDGADPAETARRIKLYAELTRRQGYDVVRPLALDMYLGDGAIQNGEFNPDKLNNADLLLAELKKQGIYTYLSIAAYRVGLMNFEKAMAETYSMKARMYLAEPEIRARWRAAAAALLSHVNPYTGVAWKDEPAIICLEFYNEQELGLRIHSLDPSTKDLFHSRWNAWLESKYGSIQALSKAWGGDISPEENALGKITLPETLDGVVSSGRTNDFGLFVSDLSRESFLWCQSVVRDLGYKGLVTQFNCSPRLFDTAIRSELSPIVSYNSYASHPSSGSKPGSRCNQASSVGALANYIRGITAVKLTDRPIFVTEHNQAFWNKYQHEDGLVFPSYAALQDFDAVMVHEDPVELEIKDPIIDFTVARNPVARANEFLAACLYKRGDVAPSPHLVELHIPSDYLETDNHGNLAVSSEQNKISLITGFGLTFPDRNKPELVPSVATNPDLRLSPSSGSSVKSGEWSVSVSDSLPTAFSLDTIVDELKAKAVLPSTNISQPSKGVFQSDTGEITLRGNEKLLKVVTPRSEGVSLEANRGELLAHFNVEYTSVPATVAVCSVDGRSLESSSRIVLIYSTEVANSGMTLSADRVSMVNLGTLPVLMRTGRLKASLRLGARPKMEFFALGMDGTRREKVPFKADSDGIIHIDIDTSDLRGGPTPFFELVIP